MEVIEAIYRRRSIRSYTGQPVEAEKLDILLKAAMAAPSAVNSQPWEFVVVTDNETLGKLRSVLLLGKYMAPAAIAVCANQGQARNPASRFFWEQDCAAAMENILVAAAGLGLGSVWIGVHPVKVLKAGVRRVLGVPRTVEVLGLAYIGYPAEEKVARTQYREDKVFWQAYGKTTRTGID